MKNRHSARAKALAQVAVLVVCVAVQHVAFAYAGETFLNYLGTFVIGPAAVLAIMVALFGAMFRPELVSKGLWISAICIVVFLVIREGDTIINMLRAGS